MQTDDGEQLLGRMLGPKASRQTLKNLRLESGLSNMSPSELLSSIKKGSKAILSNGWEISTAKVNYEDRIEIKGRVSLTDAEKRLLKEQGAFIERINWTERVFIPTGDGGIAAFTRITASKPVVDLIEKNQTKSGDEIEQGYGIPGIAADEVLKAGPGGDSTVKVKDVGTGNVSSMKDQKQEFHEAVVEKLIEQLKAGTAPWQKSREAEERLQARAAEQERLHEQIAQRVGRQMKSLVVPSTPTLYLKSKGIPINPGVLTDADGKKTYIPAQDADGKAWTSSRRPR